MSGLSTSETHFWNFRSLKTETIPGYQVHEINRAAEDFTDKLHRKDKFRIPMKKRSCLKYIFHAVVIVGVIFAGTKYLSGDEVAKAFHTFNYWYAPFILAFSTGYFLLKGWRFVVLMRPISDLPWLTIMKGYLAGQAVALLYLLLLASPS